MEEIYKVNDSNTKILKEHGLSDFVFSGLMEAISSSEFIANLVSTKRRTAAEMPKDKDGKIIVDLTNPHKLENMDYFRKAAIKFKNTGKYCDFREDNNPTSPWMKFWTEEKTRIKNGMIREDGEWIPGNLYQYWNYGMMVTNKEVDGISYQRENLPDPWLGNYLLSHYINQARHEKLFAELLKKRGAGWSFSIANEAINNSLFNKKFKTVFLATLSDYLFADDGTITKCWTMLNHLAEHTAFPRLKLTDRADEKVFGYIDEDGIKKGSQSSIAGLTLNDNYHKHRGRRGLTIFEEYGNFKNMDKAWTIAVSNVKMGKHTIAMLLCGGCVCAGTKVWKANGEECNIEDLKIEDGIIGFDKDNGSAEKQEITFLQPLHEKRCFRITTNTMRSLECSFDHPILKYNPEDRRDINGSYNYKSDFVSTESLSIGDYILVANKIDFFGEKELPHARLLGILLGDGSYRYDGGVNIGNADYEVYDYISSNYDINLKSSRKTKDGRDFNKYSILGFRDVLRESGMINQTGLDKRLPQNIGSCNKESICEFVAGYFDADGTVAKRRIRNKFVIEISISSIVKENIFQLRLLLQKLGIHCTIRKRNPRTDKKGIQDVNPWYELTISDKRSLMEFHDNIKLLINRHQEKINEIPFLYSNVKPLISKTLKGVNVETVLNIEYIGVKTIYNLTAESDNTYLANGIITHNTGGVTGESFESANKMFYNPMSYSIKPIPNVYDKRNGDDIGECGMFWGNYLNLDGYSDKDGNPDVIGALIATYQDREHKKKNTVDKAEYIQSTAEHPIYPSEAMMRTAESIFPTVEVQEYLNDVTRNEAQFVAEHTAAKLFYTDDKKVWYKPDFHNEPCRKYPIIGENPPGCIELFYPPKKDETIPRGIYVIGVDPVDDDYNPRGSLASAIVFNIYTDTIVAELTGRSMFASDFFEDVLKLSLLYNADIMYEKNKKRFYEHFERKNQLDRLMDEPTFLTGMMPSMKKTMAIGNHRKGCYTSGPSKMIPMNLYNEYMREENKSTGKLNLYSIRSIGLLRETVNFSPISGNYDRISAMGMVMIARQAMKKDIENMETQGEKTLKSLYSDKGFQRLYGGYVTNRKSVQNQFGI